MQSVINLIEEMIFKLDKLKDHPEIIGNHLDFQRALYDLKINAVIPNSSVQQNVSEIIENGEAIYFTVSSDCPMPEKIEIMEAGIVTFRLLIDRIEYNGFMLSDESDDEDDEKTDEQKSYDITEEEETDDIAEEEEEPDERTKLKQEMKELNDFIDSCLKGVEEAEEYNAKRTKEEVDVIDLVTSVEEVSAHEGDTGEEASDEENMLRWSDLFSKEISADKQLEF